MNPTTDRALRYGGPGQNVDGRVTINTIRDTKKTSTLLISSSSNLVKRSYYLPTNETSIRQEIFVNGPVVAIFHVYDDFLEYKKGIYVHKWGSDRGAHAVKIIGWGEEDNLKYWLISNSLNTDWGEDGFFRMLRGFDHCNIENLVYGGIMKI
ncbi:hypothetical protein Y032_0154g2994 [Ancylostoma ceylanicum]|nr:hypothetical protein Y032_0154g2994 [Ancylostoma ceylanicum]